jgi:Bacterial toxin homologue of phage lysozyme, C-term
VKTAFSRVGRLDEPKGGFSGLIDYPLDGAIRRFQRDNGLRADGFLRPGGPTQRTLLAQLRPAADARDEPRHRIDFDLISELEGGQRLEGYVPLNRDTGKPFPQSGVTIGTGFDLGQHSRAEIEGLNINRSLKDKLVPHAQRTGREAVRFLTNNPLRIAKEEADALDREAKHRKLDETITVFNTMSRDLKFEDLPPAVPTVVASLGFNMGPRWPTSAPGMFGFTSQGDIRRMVEELENFGAPDATVAKRRRREADYLRIRLLPPVPTLKPAARS